MGLLSAAIFQGAGQGLNALSQGMFRQVEREAEEDIWQKRNRLLSEIQRENAKNIRKDDLDFREQNAQRARAIQAGDIAAQGEAQTAAEVARLNDPGLSAAQSEAARRAQEQQIALLEERRNDPRVKAAEKEEIDNKLEVLGRELRMREGSQIRVTNATRATQEGDFGKLPPKVQAQYRAAADQYKQLNAAKLKAIENQTWSPKTDEYQRQVEVQILLTQERMNSLLGDGPSEADAAIRAALLGGDKPSASGASASPARSAVAPQRVAPAAAESSAPIEPAKADPYEGMSFAQRREAVLAATKAQSEDSELNRLQSQYKAALQANKGAEANNILAQINKIKRERYGKS